MTPAPAPSVGSASIWVLGRVAGPARKTTVLHADQDAIHLDFEGTALSVLGARALKLPYGVLTLLPDLPAVSEAENGVVENGVLSIGPLQVLVTNIVDTTVPVLSEETTAWGHDHLRRLVEHRVSDVWPELPAAGLEGLSQADPATAVELLGSGPGLTPLGDETVAGFLATAVAIRHPRLPEVRGEVALNASDRTSVLGTTLLMCAARGEAIPQFRSFMNGVVARNSDVVSQSLELMLDAGGPGSAGFLTGALHAFGSVSDC